MRFLYSLPTKRAAKMIACGLLTGAGILACMGQAHAEVTAYISGAGYDETGDKWMGTSGKVDVAAENPGAYREYTSGYIYGSWQDQEDSWAEYASVTITGGTVKSVYGGFNAHWELPIASYNTVNITGGVVTGDAIGGWDDNVTRIAVVMNNTVNISAGKVTGNVYGGGGCINKSNPETGDGFSLGSNKVNISGGEIGGKVYGGYTNSRMGANGNEVNISGGEIRGDVYGGGGDPYQGSGDELHGSIRAEENKVTISGGKIAGNVYGGYGADSASQNKVNISGGEIGGDVYGGYGYFSVKANEVTISGGTVHGIVHGNCLNAQGTGLSVGRVGNLASIQTLNFTFPAGYNYGKDLLIITGDAATELVLDKIQLTAAPGAQLVKKTTTNLIHKTGSGALTLKKYIYEGNQNIFDADGNLKDEYSDIVVFNSPLRAACGKLTLEALDGNEADGRNDLVFTVLDYVGIAERKIADNAKSHVETRANAAALLNEGADFLLSRGMANATAATEQDTNETVPFFAVGGGNMRYATGSHVDSKSWHGVLGVAKQIGPVLYGVAMEHGKSNYDSYVNTAHGSGQSRATGGAFFAEARRPDGVHYDASLRAGRVYNDYRAVLLGLNTGYKESSAYYGLSFGGGKEFKLNDRETVDAYGRYYWTHTHSAATSTLLDDELSFAGINSHRLRLGGRYSCQVKNKSRLYAGLAWQREFAGKAKAVINGESAPSPSLQGNSALIELGWNLSADKNTDISVDLNGWAGKQRGLSGSINLTLKL